MYKVIAALAFVAVSALMCQNCSLPRCGAGDSCTWSGAGDSSMFCDGAGCQFTCDGAGDCYFDCLGGGCSVTAKNAGDVYLSCEVGHCSMDCQNAGSCYLTYCPTGCTCPSCAALDAGTGH